ncbi:heterokaryon incompatibility protein-domain-containing protein [Rhexocercosporidium sp. MPI-PUGE-AT-0058]|nr:heterokaryon incompatibility protein-domain-containing protein [Rhexocercosporidium sp. MPI-PUGE-AT-0058]
MMPNFNELAVDVSRYADEAKRGIANVAKRQWRLRFTNSCRVCNDMDLKGHEGMQVVGWLHLIFTDIQDGARRGCCYCALLVNVCRNFVPGVDGWVKMSPRLELELKIQYGDTKLLELCLTRKVPGNWLQTMDLRRLEIYAINGHHVPFWPQLGSAIDLSSHSGSEECYDFLRTRTALCLSGHQSCQTAKTSLPTRVLDVDLHGTQDVKLYEPRAVEETGRYIALSHCWGGHEIIKTTSANLTIMKKNINWDALPRTFQDAIKVARELQVRWVWIDSLCILQDDKADWEIEAAQMGTYYHKAFLTVAAASSPNPATPFICPRDPIHLPHEFQIVYKNDAHPVKVRPLLRERYVAHKVDKSNKGAEHEHRFGPLSARAWCWQENSLSTRIVHYTPTGLVFECQGDKEVDVEDRSRLPVSWVASLPRAFSNSGSQPFSQWHELVKTYSERSLTFAADKLPAIGGAAERIHQITGSLYLAGLWKDVIAQDLLWSADLWGVETTGAFTRPPPTPTENGCPSWSWASLTGRLEYKSNFHLSGRSLITVIDTHVSLTGLNLFGQVSSASITLTGSIIPGTINTPIPTGYYNYTMRPVQTYPSTWVNITPDTILENCHVQLPNGEYEATLRRSRVAAEGNPPIFGKVYCLLVYEDKEEIHGLVLVKSDTVAGAYTRIGCASGCGMWKAHEKKLMTITLV